MSVRQVDAHAGLRDTFEGSPHHRACAMRRVLTYARATQVGIRSLSAEEAAVAPTLPTELFFDHDMRDEANWLERIIDSLGDTAYITIDVDGLDPSIMPATARPEPGGLSWYELLALVRLVNERRTVVGCDVVELSPIAALTAPDALCARLVQKLVAYRFANAGHP